jgi:hypothetical protein
MFIEPHKYIDKQAGLIVSGRHLIYTSIKSGKKQIYL